MWTITYLACRFRGFEVLSNSDTITINIQYDQLTCVKYLPSFAEDF